MTDICLDKELQHELIEKFPVGIYEVDFKNLKFKSPNHIILEYTGYTKEEFENLSLEMLLTKESYQHFLNRLQKRSQGEQVSPTSEYEIKTKDGGSYWVLVASTWVFKENIPESAIVFAINITDQKNVEFQLSEERNKAQLYLGMAFNIFVALNKEGKIDLINKVGCDVLGIEECVLFGQNWIENYVAIEDKLQTKILFEDIIKGDYKNRILDYTNYIIDKDNAKHLIKWKIKGIEESNKNIKGIFLSGDDITSQYNLENELLKMFAEKQDEIVKELKSRKNKYIKKVESPTLDRAVYMVANGFGKQRLL